MPPLMQLAAHEARQGHGKLAQELKELVDAAKAEELVMRRPGGPVPLVQPKGELAGLLSAPLPRNAIVGHDTAGHHSRAAGARP